MSNKLLILVTNDDGINSQGIQHLINLMSSLGEVYVVAPNKDQSGMAHSITINSTITYQKIVINPLAKAEYQCTGTPVDCVKIAINKILPKKPDLCVSGINHGSNSSINIIYSGTMSAAIEASIHNIPAIGFSLCDDGDHPNFILYSKFILSIVKTVLKNKLPKGISLNVNIPKLVNNKIKGIKICRQSEANWVETFHEYKNSKNKKYYWLTGNLNISDLSKKSDELALLNHYISIVPVKYDLTNYSSIDILNSWNFN